MRDSGLFLLLCMFLLFPLWAQTPWELHVIDASSQGADGIRLADFNEDGYPDLVTGWEEGDLIRIYLHPGPLNVREPWPSLLVGEVDSPEDAVFADLDGDGVQDVVSACEGVRGGIHFHFRGAGRAGSPPSEWGTYVLPASLQDHQKWMFCLPHDVDAEYGMDLVCGSKEENASIGWFRAPADARNLRAWSWNPLAKAGWIMSIVAEDMDGDGQGDLLFSDRRGETRGIHWLQQRDSSSTEPPWRRTSIGAHDREVMFLDTGDLDGDGLRDVVAAAKDAPLLFLRRFDSTGSRWMNHEIEMPSNSGTGKSVRIADLDLDDQMDLVVSTEQADGKHGVFWLKADSTVFRRNWRMSPISGTQEGTKFDLLQLLDLDGDGDLDVLTCEEEDNLGVIWYENPRR